MLYTPSPIWIRRVLYSLGLLLVATNTFRGDTAEREDPRRALVNEFSTLLKREPRHVGALYYGARVLAGMGDHAAALVWLEQLEQVGLGDELDPDDFGAWAESPAFRTIAARFAAAAPPIGQARLIREIPSADLLPEGTAWDPRRRELLVSSGRRRMVLALDENGRTRDVVTAADHGILAVLGMTVDPGTDSLWVATSAAPFMATIAPGEETGAILACIDLQRRKVVSTYPLAGPVLLNDLARAADGSIYVTESNGGTVYRLAPSGVGLTAILPAGTCEGANGIIVLPSGALLVADFHGLTLIQDPAGSRPRLTRLTTPDGLYLGGIDGLAMAGGRVIGIQNLIGRGRIWSLSIDESAGRVAVAKLLLRGHPDLHNPTTGVARDGRFLFIADPKLQQPLPGGGITPIPPGRIGHKLLALDLVEGN